MRRGDHASARSGRPTAPSVATAARGAVVAATLVGALALSGCAAEPGSTPGDGSGGATGSEPGDGSGGGGSSPGEKGSGGSGESSWSTPERPPTEIRHTEPPPSFPSAAFPIPASATIVDVGERGAGHWYLVLRAPSPEDAARLWDEVRSSGGFVASDETTTTEGGISAVFSGASITVQAVTQPEGDGSVLLNFDLAED